LRHGAPPVRLAAVDPQYEVAVLVGLDVVLAAGIEDALEVLTARWFFPSFCQGSLDFRLDFFRDLFPYCLAIMGIGWLLAAHTTSKTAITIRHSPLQHD
jgi:hypothetical protein